MIAEGHDLAWEAIDDLAHFYLEYGEIGRAMHLWEFLQKFEALPETSVAALGACYSHFSNAEALEDLTNTYGSIAASPWGERLKAVIQLLRGDFESAVRRFGKTLRRAAPGIELPSEGQK